LEYWKKELANRDSKTVFRYLQYFKGFIEFMGMTPDQILAQRDLDLRSIDRKVQRRFESEFKSYLAKKRDEGFKIATQQVMYASIRSFFEIHYCPLIMRKGDYPKGDSDGVKRATNEAVRRVLVHKTRNSFTAHTLVLFIKDTGLRISDVVALQCGDIPQQIENKVCPIQINVITEKTNLLAKVFIGQEAIDALKAYFEIRKVGSKWHKEIVPEKITAKSPLFRSWTSGEVKPLNRITASHLIRNAFLYIGEKRMSAHSLRKKLQTDLEKAGINSNWIDQILGHQLINSRDAYSLPTDEELSEAYLRAYQFIRVLPKKIKNIDDRQEDYQVAEARNIEEVKALLSKGYKFEMELKGVMLFIKKTA
jgi:integrase